MEAIFRQPQGRGIGLLLSAGGGLLFAGIWGRPVEQGTQLPGQMGDGLLSGQCFIPFLGTDHVWGPRKQYIYTYIYGAEDQISLFAERWGC